jgi:hypothetical protein
LEVQRGDRNILMPQEVPDVGQRFALVGKLAGLGVAQGMIATLNHPGPAAEGVKELIPVVPGFAGVRVGEDVGAAGQAVPLGVVADCFD